MPADSVMSVAALVANESSRTEQESFSLVPKSQQVPFHPSGRCLTFGKVLGCDNLPMTSCQARGSVELLADTGNKLGRTDVA